MSPQLLRETKPTARKPHLCDLCGAAITPGDTYTRATLVNDGAIYDHFELILPRHSVVRRVTYCSLEIATPRFSLTVTPLMTGANKLLPDEFEELYLGRPRREIVAFGIDLELKIEFEWWSFLVLTGWEHYDWLDSFVDKLVNDFSFDAFVAAIGWRQAVAAATASHNLTRRPRKE